MSQEEKPRKPLTDPEELKRRRRARAVAWRLNNQDKVRAYSKQRRQVGTDWAQLHPEEMREIKRRSAKKHHVEILAKRATWRSENREILKTKNRAYMARKRAEDPVGQKAQAKAWRQGSLKFKLKKKLRGRINCAIHSQLDKGFRKCDHTMNLIGCCVEDLIRHIEKQFKPGMSWDNWSLRGWHLDHIRPCASFDLFDPEQQRQCFHWSNLQPLWATENQTKGDKWDPLSDHGINLQGGTIEHANYIILGDNNGTPLVNVKHEIQQESFNERSQASCPCSPGKGNPSDLI